MAPKQNRSVKETTVDSNNKKHRTDARPQQKITSLCALARTSTGEQRACGLADWMFLIFLLLFGSSQKEGVRLHYKAVQSKKLRSIIPNKYHQKPTLVPTTDNFPTCVGPNIHGGAEALRAGRLDVLDLFASFWIKPKRRRTVAPENRLVKEAPVNSFKQKQRTDALPNSRQLSYVRWPEHPRGSGGHAGRPIGCS
jgi:hypothetical protein